MPPNLQGQKVEEMEKGEKEEGLCLGRSQKSGEMLQTCLVCQTPRMPLCGRDKGCYLVEMEQASLGWGVSLAFDGKNML